MRNEEKYQIEEDEIRILGGGGEEPPRFRQSALIAAFVAILLAGAVIAWIISREQAAHEAEPSYFEPEQPTLPVEPTPARTVTRLATPVDSLASGFCELRDTTINDIPLRIYLPQNARLTLHIGRMDKQDTTVIYTAQAADIRADNGKIVGAFVLQGTPRAWGLSKRGFCAIINDQITIGVADNSPLFEEATEKGGYFFRQYPLVDNGMLVENNPKNKAVRRAICDRIGEIFMVESLQPESFHDFAQALVDLGVDHAVYLVGGNAYGWAVDQAGTRHEFGDDNYYTGRRRMPRNTSYIVWRKK